VETGTLLCIFSGKPMFCERFWMIIRERVRVDVYFISWDFPDVSVLTFPGEKHLNSSLLPLHVRHLPRHRHTPSACLARPRHRPSHHSNRSISCRPISQAPICPHSQSRRRSVAPATTMAALARRASSHLLRSVLCSPLLPHPISAILLRYDRLASLAQFQTACALEGQRVG
jgi:hypothetical protein